MNNELNNTASEVLKWMLDKEDIQVAVAMYNWDLKYVDSTYKDVLSCLSNGVTGYHYRIKPKEVHGVPCYVTGASCSCSTANLNSYTVSLGMVLDKPHQGKLKSMMLGSPLVLVTKDFFDEAVANKGSK